MKKFNEEYKSELSKLMATKRGSEVEISRAEINNINYFSEKENIPQKCITF